MSILYDCLEGYDEARLNAQFPLPDPAHKWVGYRSDSVVVGIRTVAERAAGSNWKVWVHKHQDKDLDQWVARSYSSDKTHLSSLEDALNLIYTRFLLGEY